MGPCVQAPAPGVGTHPGDHTQPPSRSTRRSISTMNAQKPLIVVTGGKRGIGFEICRQLAVRGAQVVLTARRPDAGEEAIKRLAGQNLPAEFLPLDVTDPASAAALRDHLER